MRESRNAGAPRITARARADRPRSTQARLPHRPLPPVLQLGLISLLLVVTVLALTLILAVTLALTLALLTLLAAPELVLELLLPFLRCELLGFVPQVVELAHQASDPGNPHWLPFLEVPTHCR